METWKQQVTYWEKIKVKFEQHTSATTALKSEGKIWEFATFRYPVKEILEDIFGQNKMIPDGKSEV